MGEEWNVFKRKAMIDFKFFFKKAHDPLVPTRHKYDI